MSSLSSSGHASAEIDKGPHDPQGAGDRANDGAHSVGNGTCDGVRSSTDETREGVPRDDAAADPQCLAIRELGIQDLDLLLRWRMEVLADVFSEEQPWDGEALREENRRYYEQSLGTAHRAFMASIGGEDVGCGAICLQEEMPSPDNPSGHCAYLMNIYTRPVFRRRGVARAIVQQLIRAALAEGAQKVYLEATSDAAPLYGHLGFDPMTGMMKLHSRQDGTE